MDEAGYAEWLSQFEFQLATSYVRKGAPHEYIVLEDDVPYGERQTFFEFVIYIRANGYDMEFWGSDYRVCDVGEYTYWTMASQVGETSVLNRKPIDGYDDYVETDYPQPGVNDV